MTRRVVLAGSLLRHHPERIRARWTKAIDFENVPQVGKSTAKEIPCGQSAKSGVRPSTRLAERFLLAGGFFFYWLRTAGRDQPVMLHTWHAHMSTSADLVITTPVCLTTLIMVRIRAEQVDHKADLYRSWPSPITILVVEIL